MIPSVSAWLPYLSVQVGHCPFSTMDGYGEYASTGTVTYYPAHIEQVIVQQGGITGASLVTGQLHIILGAIVAIDPRDRLIVPRPFVTRNSSGVFSTAEDGQMVRVSPVLGPVVGQHHTEVWTE